ncbi:hypothetical protein [Cyclobacterium marinum]|uniref:hypothetical protein n=1 Tax=Cyclobacterium marinum TaxID=104 RepID=UPI0016593DBA|nr:hypothetical protein [Cyclobacterium marinum]MBI0399572.1 hypothetical protein [Cyclobacterium marinum]|tara:strand:+ start:27316 stop:27591 length:276 start_codon:yes stop_codon:yes gene_type:complete
MLTSVRAGQLVAFDASKSYDPEGQELNFSWFYYPEASSYTGNLTLDKPEDAKLTFEIPSDIKAGEIHLILQVTDSGSPALTSYRRIVLSAS